MSASRWRLALWVLVLASPAIFVVRSWGRAPDAFEPPRPRFSHVLVVTTDRWPLVERGAPHGPLTPFDRSAARLTQVYAPSGSQAGSAASLWTGRWPANHGVRSPGDALAEGTWSLAEAMRTSGARTHAFLTAPFVSATGIAGFDEVFEERAAPVDALVERFRAALPVAGDEEQRFLGWVHRDGAGPKGRDFALLLSALCDALEEEGLLDRTLVVATAFAGPAAGGAASSTDARFRVPLRVRFPSAMNAGVQGGGAASLVDLAGLLVSTLGLPHPDRSQGEAPLQSKPELGQALGGGSPFPWLVIEEPPNTVYRMGTNRVAVESGPTGFTVLTQRSAEPWRDDGFETVGGEFRDLWMQQIQSLRSLVEAGATAARPATVPEAWREDPAWGGP